MKTIFKTICILTLSAGLVASCVEPFQHEPIESGDSTAPGKVKDIQVTNTNGGAILYYTLPDDSDVLYVKACYQNSKDEPQEVRASVYVDSLVIEGLGDMTPRMVSLYAVDRSENISEPAEITINPLESAVSMVYKSLSLSPQFGGFIIDFQNPAKAAVSFYIYSWSAEKSGYVLYNVLTSESLSGSVTVKGFDSVEQSFAVMVRDKYDNETELYEKTLTPLHEEKLDKTKFIWLACPDDEDWNQHSGRDYWLYNDVIGGWDWGHTAYPTPFPHSFTLNLGCVAKLSQICFWQRQDQDDLLYAHGAPKHFKIYGCEDGLDYRVDSNWFLLFEGYLEKPSGGSFDEPNTEEDIAAAREGHVFTMDQEAPPIRYFRFESLESCSGMECTVLSEITIWGNPQI